MADEIYVGPLYAPGVGHAEVTTPEPTSFPDPLGYLDKMRPGAKVTSSGSGDNVNVWKEQSPRDGRS
jgi:hypothetical protein